MRGWPGTELLLALLGVVLLAIPMVRLTRSAPVPAPPAPSARSPGPAEDATWETWLEIRTSHPPLRLAIFQDGKECFRAEGSDGRQHWDTDAALSARDHGIALQVEAAFPPEVSSAYVELTLEPEYRDAVTLGGWAAGRETLHLNATWPRNP